MLTPIATRTLDDPKLKLGVLSLLFLVSGFGAIFASSSLGNFAIRRRELDRSDYSTLFWITSILGSSAFLILALSSMPICYWMGIEEWYIGLSVIAFSIVPSSLSGLLNAVLRRRKQFLYIFFLSLIQCMVVILVTSFMLLNGFDLWAYIYVKVIVACILCVFGLWLVELPEWKLKKPLCREAYQYTRGLIGFNAINYWSRNLDNVLVGSCLGADALGCLLYTSPSPRDRG